VPDAVEIQGLVKAYRGRRAVDGLDLVARAGEVTAVLGPNGAGKTTTIECCEGLRRADSGSVRVLGLDPQRDAAELRPRVGVMLQDGGLPTGQRARDVLEHVARLYPDPLPTAPLVERLGIGSFATTNVRRLSGGQRQRLSLAVALVGRPQLVFCDEPSAGLDPQSRHAVWDLVRELRADGVSVVLTTHLMDEAEELADHVVVVDHGRVVTQGSVPELVVTGDRRTLRVETDRDLDAEGLARALGAAFTVTATGRDAATVSGPVDPVTVEAVAAHLAVAGALVTRLETGRRTLEDVFLDLTGRSLR
jgi:ABC-2 type transport system ATP-binding protein